MNSLIFGLMCLSAGITAFSQMLLKISANKKHKARVFEYLNGYVIVSYILYGLVLLLNIYIYTMAEYRYGVILNTLAVMFVTLLASIVLREKITKRKLLGNLIVIIGICVFSLM